MFVDLVGYDRAQFWTGIEKFKRLRLYNICYF